MPFKDIKKTLEDFKFLGAKSVEITGGGEPLLYKDKETGDDINSIVEYAHELGLMRLGWGTDEIYFGRQVNKYEGKINVHKIYRPRKNGWIVEDRIDSGINLIESMDE
jgi:MoaA/NifB/PqqE/SkfB family radical SAM enzyme